MRILNHLYDIFNLGAAIKQLQTFLQDRELMMTNEYNGTKNGAKVDVITGIK